MIAWIESIRNAGAPSSIMRTRGIFAAAMLLAMLFGCAQEESAMAPQSAPNSQQASFAVPQSAMDYTARYAVSDNEKAL